MKLGVLTGVIGTYAVGLAAGWVLLERGENSVTSSPSADDSKRLSAMQKRAPATSPEGRAAEAVLERFGSAGANDFPTEFERLIAEEPLRWRWIELLLSRWVLKDPQGGLNYLAQMDDTTWVPKLIGLWAKHDPEAAVAAAKHLAATSPDEFDDLVEETMDDFKESHPTHFLESTFAGLAGEEDAITSLGKLAESDAQAAVEAFANFEDAQVRIEAAQTIGSEWAKHDPDAAIAWAKELEGSRERTLALDAAIGAIAETDVATAIKHWETLESAEATTLEGGSLTESIEAVTKITLALAQAGDLHTALSWFEERPHGKSDDLYEALAATLPDNPIAIHERLRGIENPEQIGELVKRLEFKFHQPGAAEELVSGTLALPEDTARDSLLGQMFRQWMDTDLDDAEVAFQTIPDSPLRNEVAGDLIERFGGSFQIARGLEVFRSVGLSAFPYDDYTERPEAFARAAGATMPKKFAELIASESDDATRARFAYQLVEGWVGANPAEALEWTLAQRGEVQLEATSSLVSGWARFEPFEASGWVASLPEGPMRVEAVSSLASAIERSDPPSAFEWALTMPNSDERTLRLMGAIKQWRTNSREDALAGVEAAQLSPDERSRLMEVIERP